MRQAAGKLSPPPVCVKTAADGTAMPSLRTQSVMRGKDIKSKRGAEPCRTKKR